MPRPRFSLRTLMVVVTMAAVAIAQYTRSRELQRLTMNELMLSMGWATTHIQCYRCPENDRLRAYKTKAADYHSEMAEKYRRRIWQPWVGLAPDPPKPELPEV